MGGIMFTIVLNVYGTGSEPIKDLAYLIDKETNIVKLLTELMTKNMLPKRFKPTEDFQDLIVFVNRKNIMPSEWTDRFLKDGDRILILPALAGG